MRLCIVEFKVRSSADSNLGKELVKNFERKKLEGETVSSSNEVFNRVASI